MDFSIPASSGWHDPKNLESHSFICGFCVDRVSSVRGFKLGVHSDGSGHQIGAVYICTSCKGPNFFAPGGFRFPAPAFGSKVKNVPPELASLFEEARRCTSTNAYTAAVLICRKMLMNIAVAEGAEVGLKFVEYVNYLADKGYVPPNGKGWVDHIRKRGNEATHEIALMAESDARELVVFTEMLLKFIYEFPSMVPQPPKP